MTSDKEASPGDNLINGSWLGDFCHFLEPKASMAQTHKAAAKTLVAEGLE
jgi:hypothetical protein